MRMLLYRLLSVFFTLCGYSVFVQRRPKTQKTADKLRINIGSGDWECKGWVNLDFPNPNYAAVQRRHKIIPYNIRADSLPFDSKSVDIIYTSHVIEHIEDEHVQRMFNECFRVLKVGGGYSHLLSRC